MRRIMLTLAVLIFFASPLSAKTLFFDDFSDPNIEDRYEFENCEPEIRDSNPPEFGPKVLYIDDPGDGTFGIDNSLAFVKDFGFTDGIIEILWKDARLPEDADGPLLARVQETGLIDCYLIELDTDAGLHLTIMAGGGENIRQTVADIKKKKTTETQRHGEEQINHEFHEFHE